jgi:hypothetical protein
MKRLETDELWIAVDGYIAEHLVGDDGALDAALEASQAAGLPPINVAPNQGKLLMMLAEMIGARRILEIGSRAGSSPAAVSSRSSSTRAAQRWLAPISPAPGLPKPSKSASARLSTPCRASLPRRRSI